MPENLLRDKGIIVTRPQHQADGLCHLLSAAGAVPIRYPTLAIEAPHDDTAARRIIDRLHEFDLAVFISANAVQQALELIPNGLPERLKLAVVGKACMLFGSCSKSTSKKGLVSGHLQLLVSWKVSWVLQWLHTSFDYY